MYRHAHSWLDGPSEPGPTPEDCRELTNKHIGGKKHLELKEVAAAKLAIEAIEKRKSRHVFWAGSRSGQTVLSARDKISLPVRVFHQLDRELFQGVLRGQVCLTGSTALSPAVHGATRRAGHPYGRVTILLNPEMVITERVEVILATLIHHMAHAYFLVCCGYGAGQDQHDLKHGLPISALLWSIKGRFLPCSPSFPSLFRCTADLRSHPAPSSFGHHGMEGQSHCSWHCNDYKALDDCYRYLLDTLRPHKVEIKKQDDDQGTFDVEKEYPRYQYLHLYQPGTGVLDPIPRAQFELHNPSCSFIEFHYQGRAIPLDVRNLECRPKFRAHLAENDPKVVKVPKDVSTKAFQSVMQFAIHGTYDPAWQPGSYTLKGPPKIDTGSGKVSETGPFVPGEDFRVYAVAQTIGFEELRQYALQRLYSQTLLKGDPMDFVEEIYSGKEPGKDKPVACGKGWQPDKDLREFVAAFLAAEHPDRKRIEVELDDYGQPTRPIGGPPVMDLGGFFSGGGGNAAKQTNLGVLKGLKWKERLAKLRSGGGAFLEDLDKVEESLKQGTSVEPPAFVRSWCHLPWGGGVGAPLLLARGLHSPGVGGGLLESTTVPISPGYGYRSVQPARAPGVYYPGSWMAGSSPGAAAAAAAAADAGVMFDDRRGIFINAHPPAAAGGGGRGYYGVGELVDEFEQVRPFRGW